MITIFSNTLIAGIFLSLIFGIVSIFVILRKLSFLGVGISHSAFAGVALALLLGTNIMLTTAILCILVAFLIGKTTNMGKIDYDNSIGLFFSFTMALGAVFIYLKKDYNFDLMSYMFGSVLSLTINDIYVIVVTSILSLSLLYLFFKEFIFIAFDEEVAKISRINVSFYDSILLLIISVIIVVSIKLIGIILVSALLILPGTFAFLFCNDYKKAFFISVFYSFFIYFVGFLISWYLDMPTGSTIVCFGGIVYFVCLGLFKK